MNVRIFTKENHETNPYTFRLRPSTGSQRGYCLPRGRRLAALCSGQTLAQRRQPRCPATPLSLHRVLRPGLQQLQHVLPRPWWAQVQIGRKDF